MISSLIFINVPTARITTVAGRTVGPGELIGQDAYESHEDLPLLNANQHHRITISDEHPRGGSPSTGTGAV